MREIQHANVVGLLDVFATQKHVYLVFEYCEVGDLEDVIRDDRTLSVSDVQSYLQMTLFGIKACHDAWILQREQRHLRNVSRFNHYRISRRSWRSSRKQLDSCLGSKYFRQYHCIRFDDWTFRN